MSKKSDFLELVFSHALALSQSGRFKNSIHGKGSDVFIINFDRTAILRFNIEPFQVEEFNLFADDYDSFDFSQEEDRVIFVTRAGDMERVKKSKAPKITYEEVKSLFEKFFSSKDKYSEFSINQDSLSLFEEDLSYVEVSAAGGDLKLIQNDIYSGTVLEIKKDSSGFGFSSSADDLKCDFGPVALRTRDFTALFAFSKSITFSFPASIPGYCWFRGEFGMRGIMACCLYDEMGEIGYVEE